MPGLGTIIPVLGKPGVGTTRSATPGKPVVMGGEAEYLPGGAYILGSKSRDPGSDDPFVLRCGLLMGKVTANPKHLAPCFLGVTQLAYTSGGTSVTVTPAQAAEIVRRNGATGSLKYVGPPTANGTNATSGAINYSAVNTTTGVITTSTIGADKVAGTLLLPGTADGSETPVTVISDPWGLPLPADGSDGEFPRVLVRAILDPTAIADFPTDTSLQAYLMAALKAAGLFVNALAYR